MTFAVAFFVGWLKVAETLINPFGEDNDDFEQNRLLVVGWYNCMKLIQVYLNIETFGKSKSILDNMSAGED